MGDNGIYLNDEVEGIGEEPLLSSEDEICESKSDDCTDDSQDGADQEQLANFDYDEEDTDIESDISDSEGTLRI